MTYNFYDTCSLLLGYETMFREEEKPVISSITLQELEDIKTSARKDNNIKFAARQVMRTLNEHQGEYEIHVFRECMLDAILEKADFEINNDLKILATAFDYDYYEHPDETVFITNDLTLAQIANLFFGADSISSIVDTNIHDGYKGYLEVNLSDQLLSEFYNDLSTNHFDLYENEYLIIKNNGQIVDRLCWSNGTHRRLSAKEFSSRTLGVVRPMPGDVYQLLATDSLNNNQITMLCGKPGSGKTWLAFGCLFSLLDKHEIDRIIVFCNPVVAKDAARLGFYPGTKLEKLMESQVGAILSSKLGDVTEVERLVDEGKLVLIPAGDARGYEVPKHSGVYIMESQNLTCDLLRMLLQRVSEGCKVIVDGDYNEQVDMDVYAGDNNGMRKMSSVFRGEDIYGQVELQMIHRSHIAEIADKMK